MKTVLLLTLIFAIIANAEVINVPDDHETIQGAIDASEDGDTVLVAPGEYVENINFEGKAITVASLYLIIPNEAYIDSTVINGDEESSVVRFDSGEDENSILTGFTLTNGWGSEDLDGDLAGGGIHCRRSSPTLTHLNITGNMAAFGGGVFLQISSPTISHVNVTDNQVAVSGGGIYFSRDSTEAEISFSLISGNTAEGFGGGISCFGGTRPTFTNLTVVNNLARAGGGIGSNRDNFMTILNSIFTGNDPTQISLGAGLTPGDTALISYSDIEWGQDEIFVNEDCILNWGDGNIDEDPLYADPDEGDYHLTEDSPCIDTGDPDSPEDIDGSRADMGAYPYLQYFAVVEGHVLDVENDEPLADIFLTNEYGLMTRTDTSGFWRLHTLPDRQHTITAHGSGGYLDSTVVIDEIEANDTLEVIIGLLHAELVPSREEFAAELDPGDSTSFEFSIANSGNGVLEWSVRPGLREVPDPWTLRQSLSVGDTVENTRIKGVVLIDDNYYVSGGGTSARDDNFIYVLNRDGELLDQYNQFGESRYGMGDLAWDGELIWGGEDETIFGFTPEGDVVETFEGPFNPNQALAWDSDREILWISQKTSQYIAGYTRDGREVEQLPRNNLVIYGLAYRGNDLDGYSLYIHHNFHVRGIPDRTFVHKMNINEEDTLFVTEFTTEQGGKPEGAFITDQYDPLSLVMIAVANANEGDRLDIWQIMGKDDWMRLDIISGELDPEAEQDLTLTIDATDLAPMLYPGELRFIHNGFGGETIIPVNLTVTGLVVGGRTPFPLDFSIESIHPNPFNSSTTIKYSLPTPQRVTISIFDISGRLVEKLYNDRQRAGHQSLVWNAVEKPSGIYFVRIKAGNFVETHKLTLVR